MAAAPAAVSAAFVLLLLLYDIALNPEIAPRASFFSRSENFKSRKAKAALAGGFLFFQTRSYPTWVTT